MKDTVLYYVIPCYNEEEVLSETAKRLYAKISQLVKAQKISPASRILFVNDGSTDTTWEIISRLHRLDPVFSGLSLSRNRGHQNALYAGLMFAKEYCDVSISMDADLQDDVEATDEMIARYEGGCDIVYGVRNNRDTDSWFKRTTARGFYRLMEHMGVEMIPDCADFRLKTDDLSCVFVRMEREPRKRPAIGFRCGAADEEGFFFCLRSGGYLPLRITGGKTDRRRLECAEKRESCEC